MYDAVAVEQLSTPVVALVREGFEADGKSAASAQGIPGIRLVSETVPSECTVQDVIETRINKVTDDIIAALTRPLTPEEVSPKREEEQVPRLAFKGTLEEVNRFFYRRGWTDGFPIIPPTEEAVKEMLTGTDLPRDHVVAKLISRLGKATIEKIAINAVMAGALPVHLPALIAGVEALADPVCRFDIYGFSTSSFSALWIINGPVRHDINVNCGVGAMSPGNIANAAIGRAMYLIMRNIGGVREGIECMGVLGHPGKYSMVIGENEEKNPWEPLHVERGLKKEDSAVTLFYAANSFKQNWPHTTNARGVLETIIYETSPGTGTGRSTALLLPPENARWLAEEGWTKSEIRQWVKEFARRPAYEHLVKALHATAPKHYMPFNESDTMPMYHRPEDMLIVVVGDGHNVQGQVAGVRQTGPPVAVTKKIVFPSGWEKLVAKYKRIVSSPIQY